VISSESPAPTVDPEMVFLSILRGGPDPYEKYRLLRETAPVLRTRTGDVVLSRFADCDTALRERRLGKGDVGAPPGPGGEADAGAAAWRRGNMLFSDPPAHTRLRRPASTHVTRAMAGLRATIADVATRLVDGFTLRGGGDFIGEVANELPLTVIQDLVDVPVSDREWVVPLARDLAVLLRPFAEEELLRRGHAAHSRLVDYFADLLEHRRRAPGDDLLSRLLGEATSDGLDVPEIVAIITLFFAAGFDTTSCLLGNGLLALLAHPDQFRLLAARPDLLPTAVEEMLRFEPPAQLDRRVALRPCEIVGERLEPGQFVITVLAGANRDPLRFPDPDRFDVTRADGGSLSFAAGIHFCLGAQVARIQAEAVFGLLSRVGAVELDGAVIHRTGADLHGPLQLPVRVMP
jgi:cytochrome P450